MENPAPPWLKPCENGSLSTNWCRPFSMQQVDLSDNGMVFRIQDSLGMTTQSVTGWWFWNMTFNFPYIGNNHPNWLILIFFRGVETTNQMNWKNLSKNQPVSMDDRGFWTWFNMIYQPKNRDLSTVNLGFNYEENHGQKKDGNTQHKRFLEIASSKPGISQQFSR